MKDYDNWHDAFNEALETIQEFSGSISALSDTLTELDQTIMSLLGFERGHTGSEAIKKAVTIVGIGGTFGYDGFYFYPTRHGLTVFNEWEYLRSAKKSAEEGVHQ